MKLITKAIIIATLVLGLTGCSIQDVDSDKNSSEVVYKVQQETKIIKVGVNLNEPGKMGENYTKFLNELAKGGLSAGAKNSFNIDLKEGQCLKIQTDTKYPITVMLKDNSTGEYVYNNTSIPEDNLIITDLVSKEGQYELMIDFNETEVFNFQVFTVNNIVSWIT
jgi:hypothetical protein